ncbi:MAG: hypothetical protein AAFV93_03510 [Chloroflexota bacterium]
MAQSTSHPDCVHCKFMVRHKNGEYRCRQHDVILHTPVSIFCNLITPPEEKDADYEQWFTQAMNAEKLDHNTLYTWVETPTRDKIGVKEVQIDAEVIATITSYLAWSAGTFWQVIRTLRQRKRNHYKQHGYNIDDGS